MKRRSFLRTLAGCVPAAVLPQALARQAQEMPLAVQVQPLGAHQDRTGTPHSLGFSTILFRVTTAQSEGRVFLMEHQQMLSNKGPNLHLHTDLEEWFYVLEGAIAFQVGDRRLVLKSGESVLGPRMVPHSFASVGELPGRLLIGFTPAGRMEQYFVDGPKKWSSRPEGYYGTRDIGPSPFWK